MSSDLAVASATVIIPISGRLDNRVKKPTSIQRPKINSKPLTIGACIEAKGIFKDSK
jgi:hypothetical protein